MRDQLRNVRRIRHGHVSSLFRCPGLSAVAQVAREATERARSMTGESSLELYDLHFLRQVGANAASFSPHQDIHDTGVAETSSVHSAMAILVGGWRL